VTIMRWPGGQAQDEIRTLRSLQAACDQMKTAAGGCVQRCGRRIASEIALCGPCLTAGLGPVAPPDGIGGGVLLEYIVGPTGRLSGLALFAGEAAYP
jgi:hypothetical protein